MFVCEQIFLEEGSMRQLPDIPKGTLIEAFGSN